MKKYLFIWAFMCLCALANASAQYFLSFNSWDSKAHLIGEIGSKTCIHSTSWSSDKNKLTVVDKDTFGECAGKDKLLYISFYIDNNGSKGEYVGQIKFHHWSEGGFLGFGSTWYTQLSIVNPPKSSSKKLIFDTTNWDLYRNGAVCASDYACAYPKEYKSKSDFAIDLWLNLASNY